MTDLQDINWDEILASNKLEKEAEHIKKVLMNAVKTSINFEKDKIKDEKRKYDIQMGVIRIDNYMENARDFYQIIPYFYDKSNLFWIWNKELSKYEYADDVDIMRFFDVMLGFKGQTVTSKIKTNTLEAMKRYGREKQPKPSEKKWIQFKDKAYSIFSGKIHQVTPDYFFTNPIPFELGETDDTPTMDKLFAEWVGEENKHLLYEIIAYCCYTDYPIHKIFCFIGAGSNGKSRFMALLSKFLGLNNICSTELDILLDSRFESFKLYKKLACFMGETNFGILTKTSMLKKLSGQDYVGYEMKNKQPFEEINYAKIIISSNSLPISDDTTDGFYRRWMIIDFPNQFNEGVDILNTIPEVEYSNLARKVCKILPEIIKRGKFSKQGDINESREKYILASNPISSFLKIYCDKSMLDFESYGKLHTFYNLYLAKLKKRRVKTKEFKQALEDEGFWVEKTTKKVNDEFKNGYWIEGLKIKSEWENYADYAVNPTSPLTHESQIGNLRQLAQKEQKIRVFLPCSYCGLKTEEGNIYENNSLKPICIICYENKYENKSQEEIPEWMTKKPLQS